MALDGEARSKLAELHKQLGATREAMVELLKSAAPEPVEDATFQDAQGSVTLGELFGGKDDLIVIHNMGDACPYCTLWADGFNGMRGHLENRAALVVVNGDEPAKQQAFAESRGWTMRMVQDADGAFTKAMGFRTDDADGKTWLMPGYSTFRKNDDGQVVRIASDMFGPGDLYNPVWHMFPLLADGVDGWQPKFEYP